MAQILIFLWAIFLSILPISELRGGIIYAILNGVSPWKAFLMCTIANIIMVFFIFLFLDFLHKRFLKIKLYEQFFNYYLIRIRKRVDKFEKQYAIYGFLALTLFVAVPLPVTGAWTGCLISWLLSLERKKSILAVSSGVLIAGILVLLASLGIISLIKLV